MTPAEYRQWKEVLRLTGSDASRRLGIARNTDAKYSSDGEKIPEYIALACAAVARGIQPWPK